MKMNHWVASFCGCLIAAAWPTLGEEVVLQKPFGMEAVESGRLYVADIDANRIVVFDPDWNVVETVGHVEGYGDLSQPFDVKFHDGRFYLIDVGKNNVLIVDERWRLIRKIGIDQAGSEPGQFSVPHALAVTPDGTLYVADTLNHRVQVFDAGGGFVRSIDGQAIGGSFPLDTPAGIGILPDGRLVISDYGDHPPVITDADGNVLRTLEPLGLAYGVAVGADRFAIVATYNNTVDVYSHDGDPLQRLHNDTDSDEPGKFNKPGGVAFDTQGRLIVNEWRNHRLQVFDADGKHLRTVGGQDPQVGKTYARQPRRFPDRPVVLGAFTAVLSPERVRQYHDAGVGHLYVQPYDDLQNPALRQAVEAAHGLNMKIDFVFDTFMHGTRPPALGGTPGGFAAQHPEFFTRKRDGVTANHNVLSYVYPEVRQWKVQQVIEALQTSGADGVVLDYIRWPAGNTDGYDPPALRRFEQLYGQDARDVDPLDPRWVALRSSYITQFLSELRTAIDAMDRPVTVGVYVDADPAGELEAVGRNWPVWSGLGLVDGTHHMLYTADFDELYHGVRTAVQHTGPGTRVVSCIDVYAGFMSSPEMLREGARVSALAGADEVVIVRDGSIERMGLFETIRQIADDLQRPPAESRRDVERESSPESPAVSH